MQFEDMALLSALEIDPRTTQFTVLERWSERRWFRTVIHERVKTYVLALRVERWLDGDRYVLIPDPRHFRLFELFGAWRIEQKFNRATGLPTEERLLDS